MIVQMTKVVQSGLRHERKMETISNHLANVNTPGFKMDIHSFDHTYKTAITTDQSNGPLMETGNPLDVGLNSDGFFQVQTPNGIRYSRDGSFMLNQDGVLVTQNGEPVLGEGGPITIAGKNVVISEEGNISVDGTLVGRIGVVNFNDLNQLRKEGVNKFIHQGPAENEVVPQNVRMVQGAVENSNVVMVEEITRMIETMRMYETMQKMIQTYDEIDAKAVNEVGKLQ